MCLQQGQEQEPYAGARVFLTSLFMCIIICSVGQEKLAQGLICSWPLPFVQQEMLTGDKAHTFSILIQELLWLQRWQVRKVRQVSSSPTTPAPIVHLRRNVFANLFYIIACSQILVIINVLYRYLAIDLGRIIRLWRQHYYRLCYFSIFSTK